MTDRKNPGAAFRATVVVVAVLLYPLSFGPACWWLSKPVTLEFVSMNARKAPAIYSPFGWLAKRLGPGVIHRAINWYATLGVPKGEGVACGIVKYGDPGIVFTAR
jgi:hypothetical protein